jgi:mono/diheme cytochrome c family protein
LAGAWGACPLAARPSPESPAAAPNAAAAAEVASRRHFRKLCARCHDDDFKGGVLRETIPSIPDFTDAAWQASRSDARLLATILEGRGRMPSFRGKLSDDQARGLVALVRHAGPAREQPAETDPDEFARRFAELQKQFEELRQEFRRLSPPARKP